MKKVICLSLLTIAALATSCKKENTNSDGKPEVVLNPNDTREFDVANGKPVPVTVKDTTKRPDKITVMTFDKLEHDFGVINQGDVVDYSFKFKNTGDNDLIITDAKGSCGCTVPDYPREAIKPGESGKIKVSFDSKKKSGQQLKSITLTANTEKGKEILHIKSTIIIK
jgi:outer membrane biosynthesis protein TonB